MKAAYTGNSNESRPTCIKGQKPDHRQNHRQCITSVLREAREKTNPALLIQFTTKQEDQQTQDQARIYNMNSGKNKSSSTTHSYYALFYQPKYTQTFLTKIHAHPYPGTKCAPKNTRDYALVTQTYMIKNLRKRKYSKKTFLGGAQSVPNLIGKLIKNAGPGALAQRKLRSIR